jgi:hypothetical protein
MAAIRQKRKFDPQRQFPTAGLPLARRTADEVAGGKIFKSLLPQGAG